jgi:hypothetical protein
MGGGRANCGSSKQRLVYPADREAGMVEMMPRARDLDMRKCPLGTGLEPSNAKRVALRKRE